MTQAKAWIDFLTACFGLGWVAVGMPLVEWQVWKQWRKLDREGDALHASLRESRKRLDVLLRGERDEGQAN